MERFRMATDKNDVRSLSSKVDRQPSADAAPGTGYHCGFSLKVHLSLASSQPSLFAINGLPNHGRQPNALQRLYTAPFVDQERTWLQRHQSKVDQFTANCGRLSVRNGLLLSKKPALGTKPVRTNLLFRKPALRRPWRESPTMLKNVTLRLHTGATFKSTGERFVVVLERLAFVAFMSLRGGSVHTSTS